MLLGSHLSIAGSMHHALLEAERLALDTVQVFTKNQQQWKAKPLDPQAVRTWKTEQGRLGWSGRTVSHASYLMNLASPSDELWEKSVAMLAQEIQRCDELDIAFLVHHPGSPGKDAGAAYGIARIAQAYARVLPALPDSRTVVCLENTVGAGSVLGRTFEELAALRAAIIDAAAGAGGAGLTRAKAAQRIGYCIDTCHAHAGGYDLSTRAGGEEMLRTLDEVCGLAHVRVVHVNDSKGAHGSRRDLHQHIGAGTIGGGAAVESLLTPAGLDRLARTGFAAVVNEPKLAHAPMILETPKGEAAPGLAWDAINAWRLRSLVSGASAAFPTAGDGGGRVTKPSRPASSRAGDRLSSGPSKGRKKTGRAGRGPSR